MSRRARREAVSSLAIVLPHPELPRRHSSRSSLLSQNSVSTPRTPRSSGCATSRCQSWLMTSNTGNRKSTDSWNSSNLDFGEDCDAEWKPDQMLLLSRTLDALPAHLTPFNGPIPPPNLLDKIARGVFNAKGPNEWPHSLRATRVKLIEIARQRAKDEHSTRSSRPIVDENDEIRCYTPESDVNLNYSRKSSIGIRRPLYRQSSMDFMNTDDRKSTDADSINRLSTRLQRTENSLSTNNFHPYTRSRARALTQSLAQARQGQMHRRRSPSPPPRENVPSLISPSTPSSSTLNTLSSLSTSAARPRFVRRSASTLTNSDISVLSSRSSLGEEPAPNLLPSAVTSSIDLRMQRLKRSESFYVPSHTSSAFGSPIREETTPSGTPPPPKQSFKRAPSYGMLAQEARDREKEKRISGVIHLEGRDRMNASPCPSSDEEEKVRDKQAKKPRVPGSKNINRAVPQQDSLETDIKKTNKGVSKLLNCTDKGSKKKKPSSSSSMIPESSTNGGTRPRMNLQRNPSIFGEELPHLHIPSTSTSRALVEPVQHAARSPSTPTPCADTPEVVPTDPQRKVKTLRRVKRLAPSRKISFGSLVPPAGEDVIEEDNEDNGKMLGSAFQLS
ncbi:hypothetical protein E1B28_011144 [Marasmius oreades]|uniref:Uncharacterized protein n=1 Tax=Marasmius oreades TaxID=181124 RepID=A0A9P7RTI0_9AGAR|nr:uncharacterized protein E1B28_011144 [Marasmius oreades]KAG7089459.1 hypothetical protein E1B28_011144 [Marasmius oreades]